MYVPSFKYVNILLYSAESISHLFLMRQFHMSACPVNTRIMSHDLPVIFYNIITCK
jgi:hypothetical protein